MSRATRWVPWLVAALMAAGCASSRQEADIVDDPPPGPGPSLRAPAGGAGIDGAGAQATRQRPPVIVGHGSGPRVVELSAIAPGQYDPDSMLARGRRRGRIEMPISEAEADRRRAAAGRLPVSLEARGPYDAVVVAPSSTTSFDSLDYTECCGGGGNVPPDPELAVGPNHIIAVVNVAFEIYDKSGTTLRAPTTFSSFFAADPNCTGVFDPNVLYDESTDRFFLGIDANAAYYCAAVSQTGDPTGAWNLYSFSTGDGGPNFFDYPHAGIGRDAIYMGANMFDCFLFCGFTESRVWAFDKAAMYAGAPAASVERALGSSEDTPQPLNLHGWNQGTWPTSGPHYILTETNFNGAHHTVFAWNDPFGANTFSTIGTFNLNTATGVTAGFPVNVPQSGGSTIQANDYRPLDFEYRNGFAWTTMTIACNPGTGTVNCVRWAQVDPATATVVNAGVYASSGEYRFFPDLAVNHCNDMFVGYTKSSTSTWPDIWATGRESGDAPGTLQAETLLKAGEIVYTAFDSAPRRWGDYTGMTIDPDGLRFWYLGEYSKDTGTTSGRWGTYVGSFQFSACTTGGRIIVEKVTVGGDGTFDFTTTYGPTFQLSNGGSNNSGPLIPGLYTVTETDPTPAFDLTSAVCDDGSDPGSIDLQAGETVTCTFTNTRRGTIVVEKQTDPDGAPGTFSFGGDIGGSIGDEGQLMMQVAPGTYMTTEQDPRPGFDLVNITCADPSGGSGGDVASRTATFNVEAGETVKCTFTNRQRGMVSLLKTTMGVEDPITIWDFTLKGPAVDVSDSSPPTTVDFGGAKLIPGEPYQLCETGIPAGWTLEWQVDMDGDGVADTIIPMVAGVNNDPVDPVTGYSRVYDPNFVPPPDTFTNDTRCVNFVVDPAETLAFAIDNQFPGGEPRSTGFWKNWNTCSGGNQAETAARNGGPDAGWFILEDLLNDPGYTIGTLRLDGADCEDAVDVLDKRDIRSGRKRANDAAYNLASQLLAALVNLSAGASQCRAALDAVNAAQVLLADIGFDGTGNYLRRGAQYAQANALAETLDQYNTGMLCGGP